MGNEKKKRIRQNDFFLVSEIKYSIMTDDISYAIFSMADRVKSATSIISELEEVTTSERNLLWEAIDLSAPAAVVLALLAVNVNSASICQQFQTSHVGPSFYAFPLHVAQYRGYSEAVILEILKANPQAAQFRNGSGMLPLHYAIISSDSVTTIRVIEELIKVYPDALDVSVKHGEMYATPEDLISYSPHLPIESIQLIRNATQTYKKNKKEAGKNLDNVTKQDVGNLSIILEGICNNLQILNKTVNAMQVRLDEVTAKNNSFSSTPVPASNIDRIFNEDEEPLNAGMQNCTEVISQRPFEKQNSVNGNLQDRMTADSQCHTNPVDAGSDVLISPSYLAHKEATPSETLLSEAEFASKVIQLTETIDTPFKTLTKVQGDNVLASSFDDAVYPWENASAPIESDRQPDKVISFKSSILGCKITPLPASKTETNGEKIEQTRVVEKGPNQGDHIERDQIHSIVNCSLFRPTITAVSTSVEESDDSAPSIPLMFETGFSTFSPPIPISSTAPTPLSLSKEAATTLVGSGRALPKGKNSSSLQSTGTFVVPWNETRTRDENTSVTIKAITAMPDYEQKSFEELRLEDYNVYSKNLATMPEATFGGLGGATTPITFGATAVAAPSHHLFGSAQLEEVRSPTNQGSARVPSLSFGLSNPSTNATTFGSVPAHPIAIATHTSTSRSYETFPVPEASFPQVSKTISTPLFNISLSPSLTGTLAVPYNSTRVQNGNTTVNLMSITAMPAYKNQSFEELRMHDYKVADKSVSTPITPTFGAHGDANTFTCGTTSALPSTVLCGSAPTLMFGSTANKGLSTKPITFRAHVDPTTPALGTASSAPYTFSFGSAPTGMLGSSTNKGSAATRSPEFAFSCFTSTAGSPENSATTSLVKHKRVISRRRRRTR